MVDNLSVLSRGYRRHFAVVEIMMVDNLRVLSTTFVKESKQDSETTTYLQLFLF